MLHPISRRHLLAGLAGLPLSGWLASLAADTATNPQRKRSCIVLWMAGGPSQLDTFDPKPDHANGGPFKAIDTATPGVRIGEHLPKIADHMKELAVIRSVSTREGDHARASQHVRTGYLPAGSIQFPAFGSAIAKEQAKADADLPGFVTVGPAGGSGLSAGFLGPRFAPLAVGGSGTELRVEDLDRPGGISVDRMRDRLALLSESDADFRASRPGAGTASHHSAYERAARLMRPEAAKAFDLSDEPAKLRDAYGRNRFGQGCLLARRLVERGVPFVEVTLGGWDTHDQNFDQVKSLCGTLDPAWATLLVDLKERGLLESTLVVWMGEFGRTPVINPRQGRDHYPAAWSVVLGGGGIQGGQSVGKTSADGLTVEDRPVAVPDLLATVCLGLGIDPMKQNDSNVGRPIRVVDPAAKPIREVLA